VLGGIELLKKALPTTSGVEHDILADIILHAGLMHEYRQELSRIVRGNSAISLSDSLVQVFATYLPNHDARLTEAERYRSAMFAVSALLVAMILVGTLMLQKSHRDMSRMIGQLNFQKFAMDQHAIVSIADVKGNITYVNDKFCEISGYARDELLGQNHRVLRSTEHSSDFFKGLWRKIARGNVWYGELKNQNKNGGYYWVASTIVPFLDEGGKPFQYVSIRTDITERKDTEAELTAYREELQSLVEEKTKELVEAKNQAEAANLAKSEFLANMSHEIRTPMNGVVGMADILKRTELQSEQKKMLATIQESGGALLRIIDDILDLTKIEAGKLSIEQTEVRATEELEKVCNALRPIAQVKDVRLHLSLTPDVMGLMKGDSTRLRQILMNLMGNAIKFSSGRPDCMGQVHLSAARPRDGEIQFEIRDNGIGISEDAIDALFKPFSQAEESTTRKYGGTGLGLAIVKNLVDMLGGHIDVESQLGIGSVFTVTLPFVSVPDDAQIPDISGLNVLAFIDDQGSCKSIGDFLESQGSSFTKINGMNELKELARTSAPPTVVFFALGGRSDNQQVIDMLRDINPDLKFMSAVSLTDDVSGERPDDCYRINRFPLLPSDFIEGLAYLSNTKEKPHPGLLETATNPKTSRKILLAEDNEINQVVIKIQLQNLGYEIEIASNGQEALDTWKSGEFDLVLTDCHMPIMDGFEFARHIRSTEAQNDMEMTPIIALTADAIKGTEERCTSVGMNGYITKPVTLDDLQKALTSHIHGD